MVLPNTMSHIIAEEAEIGWSGATLSAHGRNNTSGGAEQALGVWGVHPPALCRRSIGWSRGGCRPLEQSDRYTDYAVQYQAGLRQPPGFICR
jgi:hypothetical protein